MILPKISLFRSQFASNHSRDNDCNKILGLIRILGEAIFCVNVITNENFYSVEVSINIRTYVKSYQVLTYVDVSNSVVVFRSICRDGVFKFLIQKLIEDFLRYRSKIF